MISKSLYSPFLSFSDKYVSAFKGQQSWSRIGNTEVRLSANERGGGGGAPRRRTLRAGVGAACVARAEQLATHLALTDTTLAPTGKFSRM